MLSDNSLAWIYKKMDSARTFGIKPSDICRRFKNKTEEEVQAVIAQEKAAEAAALTKIIQDKQAELDALQNG